MEVPICEYIKTGGKRCGSPALKGLKNCYYHERLRPSMPRTTMLLQELPNVPPGRLPFGAFEMPFLDDRAAIQIGFMQVIHGVVNHRLNPRQATLVLSALHGAASNLRQMDKAVASASTPAKAAMERSMEAAKKKPAATHTSKRRLRGEPAEERA